MTACDRTRSNEPSANGKRHAVGEGKLQIAERALARQAHARLAEAIDWIDADDLTRLFGDSDSGIPPPPQPASRTRPAIRIPARSRNAITFALR